MALFESTKRCGLVGESEPLKVAFEVLRAHAKPGAFLSLPADQDSSQLPTLSYH